MSEPGYIHAPYQVRRIDASGPVVLIEGDNGKMRPLTAEEAARVEAAKKDRDVYEEQHCACPKCGGTHFTVTLVWYSGDDLNRANCKTPGCGWTGTVHARVPKPLPVKGGLVPIDALEVLVATARALHESHGRPHDPVLVAARDMLCEALAYRRVAPIPIRTGDTRYVTKGPRAYDVSTVHQPYYSRIKLGPST